MKFRALQETNSKLYLIIFEVRLKMKWYYIIYYLGTSWF